MPKFIWIITTVLFFLASANALSAPIVSTISGYLIKGMEIQILGSGFGTKIVGTPLVYDNFEKNDSDRKNGDIIKGKNCSHYGIWVNQHLDTIPTYTNTNQRQGSMLSSINQLGCTVADNHSPMFIDFSGNHQETILLDFWMKFSFYSNLDGDEIGQWQHKVWRVGDGGEPDGNAHLQMLWLCRNGGQSYKRFLEIFHNNLTSALWPSDTDASLDLENFKQDGIWQHIIIRLKDSGKADIYVNDVRETTDADFNIDTWIPGDEWKRATFGWYLGTESWSGSCPSIVTQYDDIYIDNTWQSVYIGDKSIWSSCTRREIQIPKQWADNSITIEVNQGAFEPCGNYFLYVVDKDGNTNANGFPIKIVTGIGEAPCPPTGLKISQ